MRLGDLRHALTGAALTGMMVLSGAAFAQEARPQGAPIPGGLNMQPAATSLARDLEWLDDFILIIITVITIFVTILLGIVIVRFNHKRNPTPAKFTHHSLLEVVWTVIPVMILVVIAIPSLQLLDDQVTVPEADLTVKATGNQWYWTYEYPDAEFEFDSYMVASGYRTFDAAMADERGRQEIEDNGVTRETWLLATDTALVVPVGAVVRLQVTASDVIHSWAMPSFGVKMDGVPGRLNETWFRVDRPGVYHGQCSELCGKDHSYMPITVRAVPQEEYDAWLAEAKAEYAEAPAGEAAVRVAAAD